MSINREKILRVFLENVFSELTDNHYYEEAPKETVSPYLTYEFDQSIDDGLTEVIPLIIDGWDHTNGDTTNLVQLISDVDNKLNRLKGNKDGIFFTFYRSGRRPVRDPKKRIKRRQIEFEIRVMGGNR